MRGLFHLPPCTIIVGWLPQHVCTSTISMRAHTRQFCFADRQVGQRSRWAFFVKRKCLPPMFYFFIFHCMVACVSAIRFGQLSLPGNRVHHVANSTFMSLRSEISSRYFTNLEISSFVQGMAGKCAHMMSVFSIGKSKHGLDILALDLSHSAGQW